MNDFYRGSRWEIRVFRRRGQTIERYRTRQQAEEAKARHLLDGARAVELSKICWRENSQKIGWYEPPKEDDDDRERGPAHLWKAGMSDGD